MLLCRLGGEGELKWMTFRFIYLQEVVTPDGTRTANKQLGIMWKCLYLLGKHAHFGVAGARTADGDHEKTVVRWTEIWPIDVCAPHNNLTYPDPD